jgi:lysophospholipase L1-like esterase
MVKPRRTGRAGKNWLERNPKKTLFLLVLAVIVALALVTERVLVWKSGPYSYRLGSKRFINLREFEPNYRDALSPTDLGMARTDSLVRKKYPVRVDENGFLMPSRVHPQADVTLVFLGGSTTECLYMEEENRFPYLAGRLLEKKTGLKVNSYNGGRAGNNSLHSLDILLNKVIPLNPDIVVLMENINDLSILLYEKTYWNRNPTRAPLVEKPPTFKTVLKNFEENLHLIRDLTIPNLSRELKELLHSGKADEFGRVRGQKITIDRGHLVKQFSLNLQAFIDLCRVRGIIPVLMTQESRLTDRPDDLIARLVGQMETQHGISYREFKEVFDLMNRTIREVGAQRGVLVIDLARAVPPTPEYLVDTTHFNDQGSRHAAGLISEGLAPLVQGMARH